VYIEDVKKTQVHKVNWISVCVCVRAMSLAMEMSCLGAANAANLVFKALSKNEGDSLSCDLTKPPAEVKKQHAGGEL